MEKGYIHVYTGNGKGKTTAAFGLALRAVCAGKKVYIGQFVKGMKYSETKAEKYLTGLKIEQLGRSCFIEREPEKEDIDAAKSGLEKCRKILTEGKYDIVILDEINIALFFKLITVKEVLDMLEKRAPHVEVILTGRYAPQEIIDVADLVTEMKEIKHYYNKGVIAREGIEN
ncbi:cob(I)alamin adenosyltransferase [Alkalithermobacter thermoalcaliphilus JW-YL-7 = DSM 7308]|uniref:Cob(I)alamin adenosyltransferase n=1 Tax=Alkalithermobacter thermoalcaliphilus JW-YL-7 = DSM 7308 TaxID=1121328 RepID=A0A150FNS6_CLOPD|nr:cob(I)alamin adenosyltransferase [[Clostridium] paradoxum JW-YL-7 = DSM 7308]SHK87426.1 cob(I)alamin adenosyltransferase [[Clostridium] paradoxum JW-YL-7 = DSM 7308]